MSIFRSIYNILFASDESANIQEAIQDIRKSLNKLTSHTELLAQVIQPYEKIYHMVTTEKDEEHVSTAYWDPMNHRIKHEDVEANLTFTSLSDFGEHHYKTTPNKNKTTTCRGFKECYVLRGGKKIPIYELLP